MLFSDLLGVTNGVPRGWRTSQPSSAREAANSSKTVKRKARRRELVYQSDFYSSLSSTSVRPLPHAWASYYISLTFAFAEALIECIQYSGKGPPTVPTWPWLPIPVNFSEQDTSVKVRPCGALRHRSRFMMVNLLCPIYKDVFGWLQHGFILGLASHYRGRRRQTQRVAGWLCGIEIRGWCRNLSAVCADTLIQVIFSWMVIYD